TGLTASSLIDASGRGNSDAGRIVIWSDADTIFRGTVLAKGGERGGNGGQVEISGYRALNFRGKVDLTAAAGTIGILLLDPATVTITGGTNDGDVDGNNTFTGSPSGAAFTILADDTTPTTVYESELEAASAHIVLEASQSITTSGTFTGTEVLIPSNINLTLRTRNTVGDGAGSIDLTASADGSSLVFRTQGTGTITIAGSTNGGAVSNVTVGKLTTANQAISISSGNGSITLANDIAAGSGTVTLSPTNGVIQSGGGITATSLLLTGSGTFTVNSASNAVTTLAANVTGAITYRESNTLSIGTVGATSGVTSGGNAIAITVDTGGLTVTNAAAGADINAGASTVTLTAGGANQAITINASANVTGTGGVTYVADNMTLTGTTTSTGSTAILKQYTAGQLIKLGSADAAGTLGLLDAELDTITAGTIQVGDVNSGDLSVTAALTPALSTTLSLITGGTITQTNSITVATLRAKTLNNAGSAITLNNASNAMTTVDLQVRNAADNADANAAIDYRDTNGVDIAAAYTSSTVTITAGGAITDSGTLRGATLTAKTLNNAGSALTLDTATNDFTTVSLRARNAANGADVAGA